MKKHGMDSEERQVLCRGGKRIELETILCKAENISFEGREIVFWGTNAVTDLNRNIIIKEGLKPDYFTDNNREKWGTQKWGIEVIPPDEIGKLCTDPLVIISAASMKPRQEISKQLEKMNLEYHMWDEVIWGRHKTDLLDVYDLLETDDSKELFVAVIDSRIKAQEIPEEYITENQYFARKEFKIKDPKEIYVDIGAYVGDTVEKYVHRREGLFKEIYAFEPDEINVNAMSKRLERIQNEWGISQDKIHIIRGVVGNQNGKAFINNDEVRTNIKVIEDNVGKEVQGYTIDSLFMEQNNYFFKVDIEGSELDMIEGAVQNISKCKPLLAICIYHRAEDLYKIPLLLKSLNEEYKMDISHHDYSYSETVLYCYR